MHHTSKKENKKEKEKNKVTKNLLLGDLNPDSPSTLELKMDASNHWTTSVDAKNSLFKRGIYSSSMVIDSFQGCFFFRFPSRIKYLTDQSQT